MVELGNSLLPVGGWEQHDKQEQLQECGRVVGLYRLASMLGKMHLSLDAQLFDVSFFYSWLLAGSLSGYINRRGRILMLGLQGRGGQLNKRNPARQAIPGESVLGVATLSTSMLHINMCKPQTWKFIPMLVVCWNDVKCSESTG